MLSLLKKKEKEKDEDCKIEKHENKLMILSRKQKKILSRILTYDVSSDNLARGIA